MTTTPVLGRVGRLMPRLWLSGSSLLAACAVVVAAAPTARAGSVPDVITAMIEAHGGMERWQSAPTVSFEDRLVPAGAPAGLHSKVTVEQGRRRVIIDCPDQGASMAWDGERAWSVNWSLPYPPRFLAQLNYYFLNLPWLTMDPGVHLEETGTTRLWDDPTDYITVKMTFGEGVGDTPRDYYTLYIDPRTHLLAGCEYIVTYAALLPEGVTSTPPHVLLFDEYATVEGLKVPTRYTVYLKDHSLYAECEVRNWSFHEPFDESRMRMPAEAVVDSSTPDAS